MIEFLKLWTGLKADKRAVTALEYALIAALIAAVMVTGVTAVGTGVSAKFAAIALQV